MQLPIFIVFCLSILTPISMEQSDKRQEIPLRKYKGDGYTLSIPENWDEAKKINVKRTMFLGPKVGNSHMAFYVTKIPKEGKSYKDAADKMKEQQAGNQKYSVKEEGDISQPGFKAYQRSSSWYAEDVDMMLITREIFTETDDAVFILSCSIPNTPHLAELDELGTVIMGSFKFSS